MSDSVEVVAAHNFGQVLRGRQLSWLSVEEVAMPQGLAVPEHGHEGAQLYFLLEGRYCETAGGASHVLGPGDAWLRPPRAPHANRVLGGAGALTLIVTVEPARFAALSKGCAATRPLRSALLDEVRAEMLRELASGDAAAATALEGWGLLLLSRVERMSCGSQEREAGAPQWLADAVTHIEQRFRESLSLSSVAAALGVHPTTLAAAFRRFRGVSVGELIRELRLRYAHHALVCSKRPVKQIAAEAGFFDQAHLGRCFARRYGVPPAALRAASGRSC
jgi:AraC family transcriptional regulator